jgi:hypothetical protein
MLIFLGYLDIMDISTLVSEYLASQKGLGIKVKRKDFNL